MATALARSDGAARGAEQLERLAARNDSASTRL